MTSVLLVDDHRLVREGLRRALEDAGYDVVGEARDGVEGIELAEQLRPHVVLMDVSMPALDGLTATRRLRSRAPDSRVVVLTMHADAELVARARAAGAAGYLVKDAASCEIVEAVRRAANGELPVGAAPDLTRGEVRILQMLADGCSPDAVAERLVISPETLRDRLTGVYAKLDVSSRSQALLEALRRGMIDLPA